MNIKKSFVLIMTVLLAMMMLIAPVNASSRPTVNRHVFFAALAVSVGGVPGDVSWSCDGTVVHNKGEIMSANLFYKDPAASSAVIIGTVVTEIDFVFKIEGTVKQGSGPLSFDTYTGLGVAFSTWKMTFTKGPYGVGTLEGTTIVKAHTTFSLTKLLPGNANGVIAAIKGTGDFEKAQLFSEMAQYPFFVIPIPGGSGLWTERFTIGFDGLDLPTGVTFPTTGNGILRTYN